MAYRYTAHLGVINLLDTLTFISPVRVQLTYLLRMAVNFFSTTSVLLQLYMDDCLIPSNENAHILKDNDMVQYVPMLCRPPWVVFSNLVPTDWFLEQGDLSAGPEHWLSPYSFIPSVFEQLRRQQLFALMQVAGTGKVHARVC